MALLVSVVTGCGSGVVTTEGVTRRPAASRDVAVAAASGMQFAFEDLIREFHEAHADIRVRATYGSSGSLYAQLLNKAPLDIYFSADTEYPRLLVEQGHAEPESEFVYAIGQLVVWVPSASRMDVARLGIESVLDPAAERIAIANPRHAPYGRAAEAALRSLGVYDRVRERLVFGENIAQAAQYVQSGAADVGILALSLALSPAMKDTGRYWLVPADSYPAIEQGSVVLNWSADREATQTFRAFVTGAKGRDVLQRYGFLLPKE